MATEKPRGGLTSTTEAGLKDKITDETTVSKDEGGQTSTTSAGQEQA